MKLKTPQNARLHSIVKMGVGFSAMIRLFEEGSKIRLHDPMLTAVEDVSKAESEERFKEIHASFCEWGIRNILLAERRKRNGQILQKPGPPSYGQIAKTLNVVLKVVVYYCHLPDCEKSRRISGWLDAAVDTEMMALLRKHYAGHLKPWPKTIKQVDRYKYVKLQELVREFIVKEHNGEITPVQFDDMYWEALNRKGAANEDGGAVRRAAAAPAGTAARLRNTAGESARTRAGRRIMDVKARTHARRGKPSHDIGARTQARR